MAVSIVKNAVRINEHSDVIGQKTYRQLDLSSFSLPGKTLPKKWGVLSERIRRL